MTNQMPGVALPADGRVGALVAQPPVCPVPPSGTPAAGTPGLCGQALPSTRGAFMP